MELPYSLITMAESLAAHIDRVYEIDMNLEFLNQEPTQKKGGFSHF
jgi:hypothetical protein